MGGLLAPPSTAEASSKPSGGAGSARMAVICTVSPCASDTEHSVATLRTGMGLGGRGVEKEDKIVISSAKQERLPHPKDWTSEQVREWLFNVGGGKFHDVRDALPSNFNG